MIILAKIQAKEYKSESKDEQCNNDSKHNIGGIFLSFFQSEISKAE
jgi:hypothetical protein